MEILLEKMKDENKPAIQKMDEELKELIRKYAKAENTIKSYMEDWKDFANWCEKHGFQSMPALPKTVAKYLNDLSNRKYEKNGKEYNYKMSTIERRHAAISEAHQANGFFSPTKDYVVKITMESLRRKLGTAPDPKEPILVEDLRAMVNTLDLSKLKGVRDRALLLIGFTGAFRRSELVSIDMEHIKRTRDGFIINLPRSKTDQEGKGYKKGIPYGSDPLTCPVRALEDWVQASSIQEGAIFRRINRHGRILGRLTPQSVRLIVREAAEKAGLDPDLYAGHSLRSGFATSAAIAGKSERAIMDQTGHESLKMVRRYIRDGNLFRDNAASGIGL